MGIARFFDKTFIVHRLKTISGNKKAFQSTATVDGHFQEWDNEKRQTLGAIAERGWVFFCELEEPVYEGDKLIDALTNTPYLVKEITKKDYGINQHLEVMLLEFKQ